MSIGEDFWQEPPTRCYGRGYRTSESLGGAAVIKTDCPGCEDCQPVIRVTVTASADELDELASGKLQEIRGTVE